jgi:hypothetical protein
MVPNFTKDLFYMLPYRPQMTEEAEQACDWTYVSRSACNPNRISVFKLNALKALANKYACPASTLEFLLDLPYDEFDPESAKILPQSFRAKKGTYLKLGTLFSTIYSDLSFNPDHLSQRASEFADQLRLRNPANADSFLRESAKPSEIYTMRSDFCSCMKNQSSDWFELYDNLPGTSILYLPDPNNERELWGRALLHRGILAVQDHDNNDETPQLALPINVMDRIYFRDNDVLAQFQNWATQHGFYNKTQQSACWHKYNSPAGGVEKLALIVKTPHCLQDHGYTHVPYMDTLYNYFHDVQDLGYDCFLSSHNCIKTHWLDPEVDRNSYKYADTDLQNTNGSDSSEMITSGDRDMEYCYRCECEIERDSDDYHVTDGGDLYCQDCFDELFTSCECCGDEIHREGYNSYYIENSEEVVCEDCFRNRSRYYTCEDCGGHFNSDQDDNFEVDGQYVCSDCFDRAGRYFTCEECGENFRDRARNYDTPTQQDLCNNCYDQVISDREEEEEDKDDLEQAA